MLVEGAGVFRVLTGSFLALSLWMNPKSLRRLSSTNKSKQRHMSAGDRSWKKWMLVSAIWPWDVFQPLLCVRLKEWGETNGNLLLEVWMVSCTEWSAWKGVAISATNSNGIKICLAIHGWTMTIKSWFYPRQHAWDARGHKKHLRAFLHPEGLNSILS